MLTPNLVSDKLLPTLAGMEHGFELGSVQSAHDQVYLSKVAGRFGWGVYNPSLRLLLPLYPILSSTLAYQSKKPTLI